MSKRRREDRSQATEGSFERPFAKLAGLKPALPEGRPREEAPARAAPAASPARKAIVRRTSAGRGGKTVTLVERLSLPPERLDEVARELKKALGCGASVEGDVVVLQGDQAERARAFVLERGLAREVVFGSK